MLRLPLTNISCHSQFSIQWTSKKEKWQWRPPSRTLTTKYGLRQTSDNVGSMSSSFPGRKWIKVCAAMSAAVTGGFLGSCMKFVAACTANMYSIPFPCTRGLPLAILIPSFFASNPQSQSYTIQHSNLLLLLTPKTLIQNPRNSVIRVIKTHNAIEDRHYINYSPPFKTWAASISDSRWKIPTTTNQSLPSSYIHRVLIVISLITPNKLS